MFTPTFNGYERDGKTPTYGGYSTRITVNEDYVLRIPEGIPLEQRRRCFALASPTIRRLSVSALRPGIRSRWWAWAVSAI